MKYRSSSILIATLRISLLILFCFGTSTDMKGIGKSNERYSFRNREEAEGLLADMPLAPVEGIWEYPADEISLMIMRNPAIKGKYEILLVESVDCRLYPGMILGSLEESGQRGKYKISLSSKISEGLPIDPRPGLATLSESESVLSIEMPELKLKITPSIIFPTLWNRLRLNIRLRNSDPLEKVPQAWIKTFPSFDLNGSTPDQPRYL